jgi:hypothetical protein
MNRLVTLTAERIAGELERLRAATAADRHWRRRLWGLGMRGACWYLGGIGLVVCALRTTNLPLAQALFGLGLYVAGLGPVITLLVFWLRERH